MEAAFDLNPNRRPGAKLVDRLQLFSTSPGCLSYRDHTKGSPYIQELCAQIMAFPPGSKTIICDLEKAHKKVVQIMTNQAWDVTVDGQTYKMFQTPFSAGDLTKSIGLQPWSYGRREHVRLFMNRDYSITKCHRYPVDYVKSIPGSEIFQLPVFNLPVPAPLVS